MTKIETQQQIELLTGKTVSVVRYIGRLSVSHIASFIDDEGNEIAYHGATPEQALDGLLVYARRILAPSTQIQAA